MNGVFRYSPLCNALLKNGNNDTNLTNVSHKGKQFNQTIQMLIKLVIFSSRRRLKDRARFKNQTFSVTELAQLIYCFKLKLIAWMKSFFTFWFILI